MALFEVALLEEEEMALLEAALLEEEGMALLEEEGTALLEKEETALLEEEGIMLLKELATEGAPPPLGAAYAEIARVMRTVIDDTFIAIECKCVTN